MQSTVAYINLAVMATLVERLLKALNRCVVELSSCCITAVPVSGSAGILGVGNTLQ